MSAWINVVGVGEDGLDGLAPKTRQLVETAEVLVGGKRHLAKAPKGKATRIDWKEGFESAFDRIAASKNRRVVVLASGDPLHFGIGARLIERFGGSAVAIIPAPGAFSLAAARMGWSIPDTDCFTVHGRPPEGAILHLAPGRRLLILGEDGKTPAKLAALLSRQGYGESRITVLERLGGVDENRIEGVARDWKHKKAADLSTIAVECMAGPGARVFSRAPGLPEEAFEHDGQITKREVRAATLARLAPLPGQALWDVGSGSGAVAIEWLRAERGTAAVALERDRKRAARIERNAQNLGVPHLKVVAGEAPAALEKLSPAPDAVFVGGGVASPGVLETCWRRLSPGGRLVANAVTLEAEQSLLNFRAAHGGEFIRIAVSRARPVGRLDALAPLMDVMQLALVKD
jgi:precorrin-6Y C5,15-methyltransferase (decarboxylating)